MQDIRKMDLIGLNTLLVNADNISILGKFKAEIIIKIIKLLESSKKKRYIFS